RAEKLRVLEKEVRAEARQVGKTLAALNALAERRGRGGDRVQRQVRGKQPAQHCRTRFSGVPPGVGREQLIQQRALTACFRGVERIEEAVRAILRLVRVVCTKEMLGAPPHIR